MFNTILFDLDGTLLPMDQEVFMAAYFKALAAKGAQHGYEPKQLIDTVWAGTKKMFKNDGQMTNEKLFWSYFASVYGEEKLADQAIFDDFYANEFDAISAACGHDPAAAEAVMELKEMGFTLALATNPIFPRIATQTRMRWAGVKPEDFELYTTYEDYNYSKPNPEYYKEVLKRLGKKPEECLMVGNDVQEDMITEKLGMQVFLITECLINRDENTDLGVYPQGTFKDLVAFVRSKMTK